MNVAVRVATQGNFAARRETFIFKLPEIKVLAIVLCVLLSALGLVYIKDLNRRMFINFQQLQTQTEYLQSDSSKLLLEESAWSAQARVQQVAEQQLNMQLPPSADIVTIKA
ncbi:MAG: cell division protein FtsL [Gammaproteobacteria bacterium]|nr:cell division protein FtsL [Gammaproteobacteria bacterium]